MVGKFGKATAIAARSNRVSKGAQRILWAGKFDPYKKHPHSEFLTPKMAFLVKLLVLKINQLPVDFIDYILGK